MAKPTSAEMAEIKAMLSTLTLEKMRVLAHLGRLMLLRQEVDAEITAIQESIEDGSLPAVPTIH